MHWAHISGPKDEFLDGDLPHTLRISVGSRRELDGLLEHLS